MRPTDLVLSYGDLIRQSGYRTRVLGEISHLERDSALQPFLLAFDRDAGRATLEDLGNVEAHIRSRHASLYYPELVRLSRRCSIRVVHAHNLYSATLALSVRRLFGYRVILDLHGRIPEEYVFLRKGGETSRKLLNALERWTATQSDHVIVVSQVLKDYLCGAYDVDDSHVTVLPDCADHTRFRWDPELRAAERARLNLEDRFVCVHLGSFVEWYRPDVIVGAFTEIRDHLPEAHLLVVTEEVGKADDYLAGRLDRNLFTLIHAKHEDVPALLNASDLGFLLLPQSPNIEVASPTKFSEYLNCGLPVLISPNVGDFTATVERSDIGRVMDTNAPVDKAFLDSLVTRRTTYAGRCVEAGQPLRWQSHKSTWNQVVERLVRV